MIPSDRWEYNIAEAVLADNEKQEKIVKKLCLKYRSYGMYDVMFNGKSEGDIQEKISSTSKNDAQKTIKNPPLSGGFFNRLNYLAFFLVFRK